MSKAPGGFTARINCMIIAGFPGIGKTTTYNEMKKVFIGAKVVDMDVRNFGTTNGMDVADPAMYVAEVEQRSKDSACIFVTCDRAVREKLQEAHLFYAVIAPEFPPAIASQIPHYVPDLTLRANYLKRFEETNVGYDGMAGKLLEGKGYEDVLTDLFRDPMPHIISPILNRAVVDQAWMQIEALTRTTLSPQQLMQNAIQQQKGHMDLNPQQTMRAAQNMQPFDPAGILRNQ